MTQNDFIINHIKHKTDINVTKSIQTQNHQKNDQKQKTHDDKFMTHFKKPMQLKNRHKPPKTCQSINYNQLNKIITY